ncbi:Nucleic acid-binding OB-fold [Arabidopsis suecica]|uniref:Nucleic acid-binding OB-fold n=1 Tax=Arabidopsis suecica TaxID=45249 RepID=A0A8T2BCT2_ARASU|nr:Nucleic acid-binding OB-fold [Arabidopsis suecica]
MAATALTSLATIKPFKTSWRVQVKIVHTWRQYTAYTGETIEMILADVDGTLIHAIVKKQQVNKFARTIVAGEWRIIENFQLSKSTGKFRATKHAFKMSLMNCSIMTRCVSLSNDIYLDIQSFENISPEDGLNENILIDVLGQVVTCGSIKVSEVNNKTTKRLEVELRNAKKEYFSLPKDGVILMLQETRPKQQRMVGKAEYFNRFPRKTISEVLDETDEAKIMCTIFNIDMDFGFYYFVCNKCSNTAFKLILDVMDSSGELKCMLFDNSAPKIVNQNVDEILDGVYDEIQDPTNVPDCLKKHVDPPQDSDVPIDHNSLISIEQDQVVISNSNESDDQIGTASTTPSSKRSNNSTEDTDENSSSTKKKDLCDLDQ